MSVWGIGFKPSAQRQLAKLPGDVRGKIAEGLSRLAFELSNPDEPKQSNVKALQGALKGEYRLRVGEYRVRYTLEGERLVILVLHVGNRRDIYRD